MSKKENVSAETHVYNVLKNALYERRLAPGAALIERSISEKLGAGRTPVRAALRKLADEGFVKIIPNRGAFVVSTTKEQFALYYDARIELHKLALHRGIDRFEQSDFDRMEKIIQKEKTAANNFQFKEYLDCVGDFFAIIMSKSGNPVFEDLFWSIYNKMRIFLVLYDDFYMPMRSQLDSIQTHVRLVEALKEKNIEKFEKILRKHSEKIVNNLRFDNTATASVDLAF
jgi:DNA-binding GntR family transcriptional regulator